MLFNEMMPRKINTQNSEFSDAMQPPYGRHLTWLESKCDLSFYLKLPYPISQAFLSKGFIYMGQLIGLDSEDYANSLGLKIKQVSKLRQIITNLGISFPVRSDAPTEANNEFHLFIDDYQYTSDLLSTSFSSGHISLPNSTVQTLSSLGIFSVKDLRGISDETLLKMAGINPTSLKKLKNAITAYALLNGFADPLSFNQPLLTEFDNCNSKPADCGVRLFDIPDGYVLKCSIADHPLDSYPSFTPSVINALAKEKIYNIEDLQGMGFDKFFSILTNLKGVGPRKAWRIIEALLDAGLPVRTKYRDEAKTDTNYQEDGLFPSGFIEVQPRLLEKTSQKNLYTTLPNKSPFVPTLGFWLTSIIPELNLPTRASDDLAEKLNEASTEAGKTSISLSSGLDRLSQLELESTKTSLWSLVAQCVGNKTAKNLIKAKQEQIAKFFPEQLKYTSNSVIEKVTGVPLAKLPTSVNEILNSESPKISELYLAEAASLPFLELFTTLEKFKDTESLVVESILAECPNVKHREAQIYSKRIGSLEKVRSLSDIAEEYELTRERIRQLESRVKNNFNPYKSSYLAIPRLILNQFLDENDGCVSFQLFRDNPLFSKYDYLNNAELLALLFENDFEVDTENKLIFSKRIPCLTCIALHNQSAKLLDYNGSSTIQDFLEQCGCACCTLAAQPSRGIIAKATGLVVVDGTIGSNNNPLIKSLLKPESERAALYAILFETNRALSYDDMIKEVFARTGKTPKKNRLSSHVGSFSDCYLWGRGTYIHKRHVNVPFELLGEIIEWIYSAFEERKIPIIGVEGAFNIYKDRLLEAGVPTHHALYSLLRVISDNRLELREYPWVCDKNSIEDRTSFAKYFYSVLEDNNGFITDAHAESIRERAMAQGFALNGLAEYSPFLINANGGWYDIEAANFNMEGLIEFANEIANQMGQDDIVSTLKVFEDNKSRCYALGIKSYDILYYLIDMIEDDLPIEATRKPHLVKSESKGLSVRDVIRKYIRNSNCPVSHIEIVEEFKINRGINISGIWYALLLGDDIVLTDKDEYWTKERLGLTDEYLINFEKSFKTKIGRARKYSNIYYKRSDVLPELSAIKSPNNIRWNLTLFKTVLDDSSNYMLLGEDGSCIVDLIENPEITGAESFYHHILLKEFLGWYCQESCANFSNCLLTSGTITR